GWITGTTSPNILEVQPSGQGNPNQDSSNHPIWAAGDQYQIHKVLVVLDQSGRGQGDLITGRSPNFLNSVTGTKAWPHQVLDPVYGWNNYNGANYISVVSPGNTFLENREFYNQAAAV